MKKSNSTPLLSVALATYNEEINIKKCLDSVSSIADEIIIVDGHSQDQTVVIAQKYPKVKILSSPNLPMFHLNKQKAIDHCTGTWILQLDADETVSSDLSSEIKSIIRQPTSQIEYNGFWINRRNYFLGRFLTKGGQYPDPTIRFYKNGFAKLPCLSVHEQAAVTGPVGHLTSDLLHYADISFSRYLLRFNRYTTLEAQKMVDQHLAVSPLSFFSNYFARPLFWFIASYFRHKGFVDGFPGFVFAFFSSLRFPVAYTKFWELTVQKRSVDLAHDWDKKN